MNFNLTDTNRILSERKTISNDMQLVLAGTTVLKTFASNWKKNHKTRFLQISRKRFFEKINEWHFFSATQD